MEHTCFIDIETIPTQSPDVRAKFRSEVKAPGNIKKPESIEEWLAENGDEAAKDAIAKTSFDPAHGHICTISWAIDDDEPITAHANAVAHERDVIEAFFASLTPNHRYTFVGHYIGGFDLRFILCRAVVLGIRIPRCIPRDPKPWDSKVFDTMTAWAGNRGTVSMDTLCDAFGIPGKGDFSGADVAEAWAEGKHDTIADYCADDVLRTRAIWSRFQAADF